MKKWRIAIPCSGLGHITRGIETWTMDMGHALHDQAVEVTVFKGAGECQHSWERTIGCVKRDSNFTKKLMAIRPGFTWRLGLATPYTFEQLTFNLRLWPHLLGDKFDIIHTQDPQIALFCQRLRRLGLTKAKVLLAHGTEEPFSVLNKFYYLQHLAPYHRDEMQSAGWSTPEMYAIGNFIDTEKFQPRDDRSLRHELGIPDDAFVACSVAAIKRHHKRIDHLLKECSQISDPNFHLIVAGSRTSETDDLINMGRQLLGERVHFLVDFPHQRVPDIHTAADINVLCSLKDMMPIALIEALSSGLPSITHTYPVEVWMIGQGGDAIDMSQEGTLAQMITEYINDPDKLKSKSTLARQEAVQRFARDIIVEQIMSMYEGIMSHPKKVDHE